MNPRLRNSAIALALRTPLLQWTTIGMRGVELAEAVGQLGQGDDRRAGDPADGDLLGVADVEDERVLAPVEQALSAQGA